MDIGRDFSFRLRSPFDDTIDDIMTQSPKASLHQLHLHQEALKLKQLQLTELTQHPTGNNYR